MLIMIILLTASVICCLYLAHKISIMRKEIARLSSQPEGDNELQTLLIALKGQIESLLVFRRNLEEASSAAHEITSLADLNSTNSSLTKSIGKECDVSARQSQQSLQELTVSFQDMRKDAEEVLLRSEAIRSIALRTQILAINASVEAAHSGEAGKGFAVIAQELNSLAQSVTKNVKDIYLATEKVRSTIQVNANALENNDIQLQVLFQKIAEVISGIDQLSQTSNAQSEVLHGLMRTMGGLESEADHFIKFVKSQSYSVPLTQTGQVIPIHSNQSQPSTTPPSTVGVDERAEEESKEASTPSKPAVNFDAF